jgi:hypothetical protein
MRDSQKNSKVLFLSTALLISMVSLAIWQFYTYATFTHDNGVVNLEGGGNHLVLALLLTLSACLIGFFMASKLLRYNSDQELHITSPPKSYNSSLK